jgi:hypothetical protein
MGNDRRASALIRQPAIARFQAHEVPDVPVARCIQKRQSAQKRKSLPLHLF